MASHLPNFSIVIRGREDMSSQGELNTLLLGYGIHQAWIFAITFGSFFAGVTVPVVELFDVQVTPLLMAFQITYIITLLLVGHTDQKFLRSYTARKLMAISSVVCSAASFALVAAVSAGSPVNTICILGVVLGMGATFLTVSWGVAFARESSTTIVLNSTFSLFIALGTFILVCFALPDPINWVVACALPLLELPILWGRTPVSYVIRRVVPIFNPLPVNKLSFSLKMLPSVILFGFVLNAFATCSLGVIIPFEEPTTWLLTLFIGGFLTAVFVSGSFSFSTDESWDFLFRPLVPVLVICLVFTGLVAPDALIPCILVVTGFMCCKALLWTLFGQMSQELRLSPIYIFGIGQAGLSIGAVLEYLVVGGPSPVVDLLPFGQANVIVLLMVLIASAYAVLPRMRDIRRTIVEAQVDMENDVAHFNREAREKTHSSSHDNPAAPSSDQAQVTTTAPMSAPSDTTSQPQSANTIDALDKDTNNGSSRQSPNDGIDGERQMRSGKFRLQCERVANRYLLSRRETEVMFLLAKGYNAERIQDVLFISRSTVKTHISHIYRKLDIHSQQELLAMVEEERENLPKLSD